MKYLLLLLLTGCTTTCVKRRPDGSWEMTRNSFLQRIHADIEVRTNGAIIVRGYSNDGGQAAASMIAGAVAEGVVKGMK